jgi:hypothetical protein
MCSKRCAHQNAAAAAWTKELRSVASSCVAKRGTTRPIASNGLDWKGRSAGEQESRRTGDRGRNGRFRMQRFLLRRFGFGDNSGSAEARDGAREREPCGNRSVTSQGQPKCPAPVSTSRAGDRCPGPRIVAPILPRWWRRGVIIRDAAEKFRRFVRPSAPSCDHDVR